MIDFADVVEYCKQRRAEMAARDRLFDGLAGEYLMRLTSVDEALQASSASIALTKSPDARNQIKGLTRLLTTTRPAISVPVEKNDPALKEAASKIERAADALLANSDRYNRRPLHYDATLTAGLFDAVDIQVVKTADLVEGAKGGPPAGVARMERLAKSTPYVFIALNPRNGYPTWDDYGLISYHTYTVVTVGAVIDMYPDAKKILPANLLSQRLDKVKLYDYWDLQYRCLWIDGHEDRPILLEEHGLPFIPIVASTAEGSGIWSRVEDQYEPFLMTEYTSGLTQAKTEILTAIRTNLRIDGFTPKYVVQNADPNAGLPREESVGLAKYIMLAPGQTWQPVAEKGLVDRSVLEAYERFVQLGEQSTISAAALGGLVTSTYSQTALLSQLGRIPLETIRYMVGRAIADALEIAFAWWRHDKYSGGVYDRSAKKTSELDWRDIDEFINIDCELDIALKPDKIQAGTAAAKLKEMGLVSDEYIHENYLGIQQSDQMQKDVMRQQFVNTKFQIALQRMAQSAMQPQPPMQPQPQGMEAGPGIPPEMMQGGMGGPEPAQFEQQMEPPDMGAEEGMI